MLDRRFTAALHVSTLRRDEDFAHLEPHVLFQASTIGALLEGRYEGDETFGELAGHGDHGLGTLNGLDGEMIALDGHFYRADVDGNIGEIDPAAKTPFSVVVAFEPTVDIRFDEPLGEGALFRAIERALPADSGACALRIDGEFASVTARSVPRQSPPYRPLGEVVPTSTCSSSARPRGRWSAFASPTTAKRWRPPDSIFTSSTRNAPGAATSSIAGPRM